MQLFRYALVLASLLPAGCAGRGEPTTSSEARTVKVVEPREPSITPDADAPLRAMSDYLAGLERFSLHTEGSIEVVLTDGQKLSFPFASEVWVRRPSSLRSDRITESEHLQFFYDGRTFTLHGKKAGYYAQYPAPATLDEAIDVSRGRLDLEAPAADLLAADPYAALTEDVLTGFSVGPAEIDGVRCQHLAFRGREVDWQIWIEDGPKPLPRRFVITSKNVKGSPEFVVELSRWNTTAKLRDKVFTFVPPKGAQRIEFVTTDAPVPKGTITKLPEGCTTLPGPGYSCDDRIYRPFYQGATLVYVPSPREGKSR